VKDRLGLVRLATWGSFRISLTYLSRELTPGSFEKEGREFNVRLTGYLIFNRAGLLLEGTLKGLRLACVAESQVQPRHITRIVGSRVDVKGLISLPRVHIAVNCGPEVKLIRICPQIDSAVVLGMGHALSAKWSQPTI